MRTYPNPNPKPYPNPNYNIRDRRKLIFWSFLHGLGLLSQTRYTSTQMREKQQHLFSQFNSIGITDIYNVKKRPIFCVLEIRVLRLVQL